MKERFDYIIQNWLRSKHTLEYVGTWKLLYNPNFNFTEFDGFKNEADILNVALFGMTAKEWKDKNPTLDGNMRDYANILQLVILVNLENLNAQMIKDGLEQKDRLEKLNAIAKEQYNILQDSRSIKKIENLDEKKILLYLSK